MIGHMLLTRTSTLPTMPTVAEVEREKHVLDAVDEFDSSTKSQTTDGSFLPFSISLMTMITTAVNSLDKF